MWTETSSLRTAVTGLWLTVVLTVPTQMKTNRVLVKTPHLPLPSVGKHTKGILNLCKPTGDNLAPSHIKNPSISAPTHTVYSEHISCAKPGLGALTSSPLIADTDLQPLKNHTLVGFLSKSPSPLAPVHPLLTEGQIHSAKSYYVTF